MLVYRIVLERYATLFASGVEGRWNSAGAKVLYTAASRALACLENVVHRSGEGLNENFKTLVIDLPSTERIEKISVEDSMSNVRASRGVQAPLSADMMSEPAIVALLGAALVWNARPVKI